MLPASSLLFAIFFLVNSLCAASPLSPLGSLTSANRGNNADGSVDHPYEHEPKCDNPIERKEWRNMDRDEQSSYIEAVKCFQSLPALDPAIKAATSRFEEFQSYHVVIADAVHQLGPFLPWHREFLRLYETALRHECGYEGANPWVDRYPGFADPTDAVNSYWDWTKDADSPYPMAQAPVFHPLTGFGGDGVPGTYTLPNHTAVDRIFPEAFKGCVMDGPFKDLKLHIGPGFLITDHCLTRGIDETMRKYLTSAAVANITASPTFETFRIQVEGEPITPDHRVHDAGHIVIGGDMSNFYSSPGDPLFYLHHAQLDRMWWKWQKLAPHHMWQVSGVATKTAPFYNISLDYTLQMGTLGASPLIRDIIDIHSERNCYTYA